MKYSDDELEMLSTALGATDYSKVKWEFLDKFCEELSDSQYALFWHYYNEANAKRYEL